MLLRVLEPELMDSEDEAREYDEMDHGEVNRQFVADFLQVHSGGWRILDAGTGTALIPIELCQREKRAVVLAIDAAEAMLRRGAVNVAAAGLVGRIHLEVVDAKSLTYDDHSFPAILSNSLVHHIEHPTWVLAELVRVLAPEGTLFVRDLMRPSDEEMLHSLVDTYALDASDLQRGLFAASLRAALTLGEIRDLVRELGLQPTDVQQTSDRHWTWTYHSAPSRDK